MAPSFAPTTSPMTWPFLNDLNVGIARMPAMRAAPVLASTSTFTHVTSGFSSEILTKRGPIILHGGHHWAKKSTTTALSPLISCWNSSTDSITFMFVFCCSTAPHRDPHHCHISVVAAGFAGIGHDRLRSQGTRRARSPAVATCQAVITLWGP
ncbi:hypothetical protein J8273_1688 [Carpediemonas membranifera]|uniref:Uncharacterized protein n=1 Tax=Carpediemonas membranifera TaxID=201153 RepID=A0A8J6EBA3_9EUKA|nr:hypothetical protein J8273_1688 [Carpediemonas membranifera]|eukprot:KAG9396670.1 hypothetical protein J8273_1688 [Carpediemonas membranifera]